MDTETASDKKTSRWPGVVFSILVPGFGLIRAGNYKKGILWLLGLQLFTVIIAAFFALEWMPLWAVISAFCLLLICYVWIWRDSFRPGRMTGALWLLFIALFAVITLAPSPASWIATAFKIPTQALEPTLQPMKDGQPADHIIVDRLSYRFSEPKRGDIIVFDAQLVPGIDYLRSPGQTLYIERLVGLPGERIKIADGKVYINGKPLGVEDGIPEYEYTPVSPWESKAPLDNGELTLKNNEYYVLSDGSPHSPDSRQWGGVPKESLYGKVTLIYFPFSRAGRFK